MGLIVVIIIAVIAIFFLRVYMSTPAQPSGGSVSALGSPRSGAYPRCSYVDIYRETGISALHLLDTIPCSYTQLELYAFLFRVGHVVVHHGGGDIVKFNRSIRQYLGTIFQEEQLQEFDRRTSFYWRISFGDGVRGDWCVSGLPPAMRASAIYRCAIAFGDCITNPDAITDYYNAPVVIAGVDQMADFSNRFINEFFSLVYSYCVRLVGHEFDASFSLERDQ